MATETNTWRYGGLFIPVRLLRAPDMNFLDKGLLAMVEALSRRSVGCTATNAYLAQACGVHETTISKTVSRLEERGLLVCSYAQDNRRTIRIMSSGFRLFHSDLEAGDDTDEGGIGETPRGIGETPSSCTTKSDKEESIRAHEAAADSPSCSQAGNAKTEYLARAENDEDAAAADCGYEDLIPGLKTIGCTDFQAFHIIGTARSHGRPVEWLQGWMTEASKRADKPGGFVRRMVEGNAELPEPSTSWRSRSEEGGDPYNQRVSPERQAAIDARHNAEYQRTKRGIDEGREGERPTDEALAAAGWHSAKEALRKRIEAEAPAAKWGARPYVRPTEEDREKIREAKAELEAAAAARQAQKDGQSAPPAPNPDAERPDTPAGR